MHAYMLLAWTRAPLGVLEQRVYVNLRIHCRTICVLVAASFSTLDRTKTNEEKSLEQQRPLVKIGRHAGCISCNETTTFTRKWNTYCHCQR